MRDQKPRPIDRLWVRLLLAAWVLGIVLYYYGLQFSRLLGLAK